MSRPEEPVRAADYRLLSVSPTATPREIRRAWKRLARRVHPDVDRRPGAVTRFQRAQRAFRRVLRASSVARPRPEPRSHVAAARFACCRCCDTYTHDGDCPRCEVPLHDRASGAATLAHDSDAVQAMILSLETPRAAPRFDLAPELRIPLLAAILALFALLQARIGLWPIATMSVAFALFAIGAETHQKWSAERVF